MIQIMAVQSITEKIEQFFHDFLAGWVMANMDGLLTTLNDKVGTIGTDLSNTPESWNPSALIMVQDLSDTVIVPIAGIIITYVLCYELITMVTDKNNMHDVDTSLFFRYLFKACIAVMIVSNISDIVLAIFDIGSDMVTNAVSVITDTTTMDVQDELTALFILHLDSMSLGELVAAGIQTMICRLVIHIMSIIITVVIYFRFIEIYLYVSIAPVPAATVANKEWGNIGTNYLRGLMALAAQGFFMMVCVGIYAALICNITLADDLISALWQVMGCSAVLCFSLTKTSSLSKSIFNAH